VFSFKKYVRKEYLFGTYLSWSRNSNILVFTRRQTPLQLSGPQILMSDRRVCGSDYQGH